MFIITMPYEQILPANSTPTRHLIAIVDIS